jgi:hypothetical protein
MYAGLHWSMIAGMMVLAGWTAMTISFTVAGKINTSGPYVYDVAISASTDANPLPQSAPVPVINSNNPNGRMAGCPTHFIEFNSANPDSQYPFTLYRFAPNPGNLTLFAPTTRGQISQFEPFKKGDSTLTFTVFTNLLADSDSAARKLKSLQVNILTMTRLANLGSGQRVIDSLGDSRSVSGLNQFLTIDLRRNGTYTNANGLEPKGDTFGGSDPDVDIVDYKITVVLP